MTTISSTPFRLSKAARIAGQLRRRIAMGEYSRGDFLPPERELAEQLSTSRKTIAEALGQLAAEGLVIRAAGRGTQIAPAIPADLRTAIRVVHPLHPRADNVWGEAVEINRGINDALSDLDFRIEQHCYLKGASSPFQCEPPRTLCPTVFQEASEPMLVHMVELDAAGIPFVVANLERRELPYAATWANHAEAMQQAVQLLADLGHRRIAYIGAPESHLFYGQAREGYLEGLRAAGLGVDRTLIAEHEANTVPLLLAGHRMAHRLLEVSDPPTAIIGVRDAYAEGAWYAIEEHGLTVGHEVSLVGCDDHSASSYCTGLTTFREPCYEMGAKAVEMLVDRIVNHHTTRDLLECKFELVMRRSAGPVSSRNR